MPQEKDFQQEVQDAWEQQEGEPSRWFAIFTEFRLMGPKRSIRKLWREKRAERGLPEAAMNWGAPSNWADYAREWRWRERADAWDKHMQDKLEEEAESILSEGLALSHNRIIKLKAVAEKLEKYLLADTTTRVSPMVIEQYRGILYDIAKEKGERVKETRLTGTKGGPISIVTEWGRGGSASDAWSQKALEAPENVVDAIAEEVHDNGEPA